MQKVTNPSLANLPDIGYYSSRKDRKERIYKEETHIHKQTPLSGLKAGTHKLTNDIVRYFPKGFQGSKNSDFYEFLSLGMVPYIIGSATLIGAYCFGKKNFDSQDAVRAGKIAKNVGAGVALYAFGKWLSPKLSRTLIHASTGVDLNMQYINKVPELPENGKEKGEVVIEYPGVFDSGTFTRTDLLERRGEIEQNNSFDYYDKIAERNGFGERMNASNQEMIPRLKKLKIQAQSMEYINKYVVAALGVVLGNQQAFSDLKFEVPKSLKSFKDQALSIPIALKDSVQQLWKESKAGKGLLIAAGALTLLDWLVPTITFKSKPNTIKTKIDPKKESEVC